jgi:hypothetical protein
MPLDQKYLNFLLGLRMWEQLLPKRGILNWPCTSVNREVHEFLAGKDNTVLDVVQYPYVVMDLRGCPNIPFTIVEPLYKRGNIIIMFDKSSCIFLCAI